MSIRCLTIDAGTYSLGAIVQDPNTCINIYSIAKCIWEWGAFRNSWSYSRLQEIHGKKTSKQLIMNITYLCSRDNSTTSVCPSIQDNKLGLFCLGGTCFRACECVLCRYSSTHILCLLQEIDGLFTCLRSAATTKHHLKWRCFEVRAQETWIYRHIVSEMERNLVLYAIFPSSVLATHCYWSQWGISGKRSDRAKGMFWFLRAGRYTTYIVEDDMRVAEARATVQST